MANTDPVADTAGVVEQVWRLGREAGHCDVFPVGAVTVGLAGRATRRARGDGRLRRPGPGVLRRRQVRERPAADAPGAGVRQGVRRRHRPARPGAAADRGRPDERGRALRAARAGRLAGRRRGGDHRPRLPAGRPRRVPAARVPRVHRRVGRDRPAGQGPGLGRHRRGLPAPPAADRRAGRDLRPDLQGQPAAALGRRRRGARGPGWPTAPSTSSPPTTRRTRSRTRTASGRPPRSACSVWRPRCRSCRRRWSTPVCSTGRASPSGCPHAPARIGRLTDHGRPLEVGEPANVVLYDPSVRRVVDAAGLASLSRNTPYAGLELPGRVVATFLRGTADGARRQAGLSRWPRRRWAPRSPRSPSWSGSSGSRPTGCATRCDPP